MKTIAILLILIVFSGCIGCSALRRDPLLGTYDLQAHDYAGNLAFEGTISISSVVNGEVRGSCKLVNVMQSLGFGKDGPYEGVLSGEKIYIDLAPRMDDGGVDFEGVWREGYIEGSWRIRSFAGDRTLGKFKAIRR